MSRAIGTHALLAALAAAATVGGAAAAGRAAVIDSFESGALSAATWANTTGTVTADAGGLFGAGNQYFLRISGVNQRVVTQNSTTNWNNKVTTTTFQMLDLPGGTNQIVVGFAITNGDLNGTGAATSLAFNNGAISASSNTTLATAGTATYAQGTVYTAYLVLNDSAADVTSVGGAPYAGGTLEAGQLDVFLQQGAGAPTFAGSYAMAAARDPIRFGLRTFSTDASNDLYVDDLAVTDGVPAALLPEPGAAGAIAAVAAAGLLRHRRPPSCRS